MRTLPKQKILIAALIIGVSLFVLEVMLIPANERGDIVIGNQSSQPNTTSASQETASTSSLQGAFRTPTSTRASSTSARTIPSRFPHATTSTIIPTSTSTASTPTTLTISPRTITAKSLVGLLCHYTITDPALAASYGDANGEYLAKGSGVIVNPQGYILTAKHMVDPQWTAWAYGATLGEPDLSLDLHSTLSYCEVGIPQIDTLPSESDIKSINPSLALNQPFPYLATAFFDPPKALLSDNEYATLDFAVLKITSPMHNCATFNLCALPASYPYTPVLYNQVPPNGSSIVNFGYPAEAINSSAGTFSTFFLKGAVGQLTDYYSGDQYFENQMLEFDWTANDIMAGRSGSPIFWKGYIIGIEYGIGLTNTTQASAIGMPAIYRTLKDHGLGEILATE